MKKILAVMLGGMFFFSTVSAPLVEANYWNDRREAVRARQSAKSLYAMGPAGAGLAEALPFLDGEVTSGVEMGSLSGTSLPSAHSSLTPDQVKALPAWLHGISSAHGSITQAYFAPDAAHRPLVVHIQDIHEEREAQLNISALINDVVRTGAVSLVGLEGAVGSFDLTPYRAFPNKTVINDVADFMVQEHMIGGGEHAGWTAEKMPTLWGIEESNVYLKNLNSFKDALPVQQRVQDRIKNWEFRLAQVKPKIFSPALKSFDDSQIRYRADALPLPEFVDLMAQTVKIQPARYPSLVVFQKCLAMEKSLNFSLVEKEREVLVQRLTKALSEKEISQLVQRTLLYRSGKLTHGAYYDSLQAFCETKGVSFSKFPAMAAYVKYVLAADQIKPENLLNELDDLQDQVAATLVRTPEEQEIHSLGTDLHSLANLAEFRMSPRDWATYERARPRILDLAARMDRLAPGSDPYAGDLSKDLTPFEGFCQAALARDKTLVNNLLAKMEKSDQKTAILLAGGFHTGGMTDLLKKNKVSYVVFTPAFTNVSSSSHYLDFLKDRPALEKLFTQEKITTKIPVGSADTVTEGYESAAETIKGVVARAYAAAAAVVDAEVPSVIGALSPAKVSVAVEGAGAVASVGAVGRQVTVTAQVGAVAPSAPSGTQSVATYTSAREGGVSFMVAIARGREWFASVKKWARSFFQGSDKGGRGGNRNLLAPEPAGAHRLVVGLLLPFAKKLHGEEKALDYTIRFYAPAAEVLLVLMVFSLGIYLFDLPSMWGVHHFSSAELFLEVVSLNWPLYLGINMLLGYFHRQGYKAGKGGNGDIQWKLENLTHIERLSLGIQLSLAHSLLLISGWLFLLAIFAHIGHNYLAKKGWWVAGALGATSAPEATPEQVRLANRFLVFLASAKTDEELAKVENRFRGLSDREAIVVRGLHVERIKELQKIGMYHRTSLFVNWGQLMDALSKKEDGTYHNFINYLVQRIKDGIAVYVRRHKTMQGIPAPTASLLGAEILQQITSGNPVEAARNFLILTSLGDAYRIRVFDAMAPNLGNRAIAAQWNKFIRTLQNESDEVSNLFPRESTTRWNQIIHEPEDYSPPIPNQFLGDDNVRRRVADIQRALYDERYKTASTDPNSQYSRELADRIREFKEIRKNNSLMAVPDRVYLNVAIRFLEDGQAIMRAIMNGTAIPPSQFFNFDVPQEVVGGFVSQFNKISDPATEAELVMDLVSRMQTQPNPEGVYLAVIAVLEGDQRMQSDEDYRRRVVNFKIVYISNKRGAPAQGGISEQQKDELVGQYLEELSQIPNDGEAQTRLYERIADEESQDAFAILQVVVTGIPKANIGQFDNFIDSVGHFAARIPAWVMPDQNDIVALPLPVQISSYGLRENRATNQITQISLSSLLSSLMGQNTETDKVTLPKDWIFMSPQRQLTWLAYATPEQQRAGLHALRDTPSQARALVSTVMMEASAAHGNGRSYRTGQVITEDQIHGEMTDLGKLALWLGIPLEEAQTLIDETYNLGRTVADMGRNNGERMTIDGLTLVKLKNPRLGTGGVDITSGSRAELFNVVLLPLAVNPADGSVTWQMGVDEETQQATISELKTKLGDNMKATAVIAFDSSLTENEIRGFLALQGITQTSNLHVLTDDDVIFHQEDGSINVPIVGEQMAVRLGRIPIGVSSQNWYNYVRPNVYTNQGAGIYLGEHWNMISVFLLIGKNYKALSLDQFDNNVYRYLNIQA